MKWFHVTPTRLRALTYLLVFLTFDLILFGAFTRLTDSGLGCPDWPGCYANLSPVGAAQSIDMAQTLMPTGPVTHIKAWIEMLHRYFASAVGALIIVRLVWCTRLKKPLLLPLLTLLWVCLQGAFGAFTVTMRLFPAVVTLHLLGALVLLALLQIQATQLDVESNKKSHSHHLRRWLGISLMAIGVQVALGGWVSSNYAVLACSQFPTCLNGQWLPATWSDWVQGFVLWRDLGGVSFGSLSAIHLTHRFFAVIVLIAIAGLIWQLRAEPSLKKLKRWLMGLLTLQIITGITNVVLGWPLLAALMHTGGAAALILILMRLWVLTSARISP